MHLWVDVIDGSLATRKEPSSPGVLATQWSEQVAGIA